ncbi:FUSC family protein [Nocardioides bruguierae]|uniref:FUSC family protein n=1 Tax=Nocardioides bruguierae TaxID=2945102 RepID=UPI0020226D97|nr:FUSC family protein [Nocardioides bruguierae]MCL8026573.1 FUSC family protein [Nocardioides bruguierae]
MAAARPHRPSTWSWLSGALTPTGRPPQVALVVLLLVGLVVGLVVGLGTGLLVGRPAGAAASALLPALVAGLVSATGTAGAPRIAARVATWAAVVAVSVVGTAILVSGRPWAAALAMAAVAVLTSAAVGAGPIGGVLGVLSTLAYVLGLVLATSADARTQDSPAALLLQLGLAAALGWVVACGGAWWLHRRQPSSSPSAPGVVPSPWAAIAGSVRSWDQHSRDGVRRAVPLAGCVLWYQLSETRDALWVLITALAILLPSGKSTVEAAVVRVSATFLGVLLVPLTAQHLPTAVVLVLAVVCLLVGLAYQPVLPVLAGAVSALGVVLLVGAPTGAAEELALRRLVDTLVGAGLALVATYLLWPRDRPDDAAAPA